MRLFCKVGTQSLSPPAQSLLLKNIKLQLLAFVICRNIVGFILLSEYNAMMLHISPFFIVILRVWLSSLLLVLRPPLFLHNLRSCIFNYFVNIPFSFEVVAAFLCLFFLIVELTLDSSQLRFLYFLLLGFH